MSRIVRPRPAHEAPEQPKSPKTKLRPPRPRQGLVARSRVADLLERGIAHPLTLVSAPAGSGKTTLIANWIHAAGERPQTAWLSLDEHDNDFTSFFSSLIDALQAVGPGIGATARSLLNQLDIPTPQRLMTALVGDLGETTTPWVVVLDDYHVIKDADVDTTLAFIVEHLSDSLRLVVATREMPRLPLARWRARECVFEIGLEDLSFSSEETELFFKETMGLDLDAASIRTLETCTEGWIVGLQLAALSIQQHIRNDGPQYAAHAASSFGGGHRYVIDYLRAEVLDRQPQEMQNFLRQTSILNGISAPLCDAVTGRHDSKAVLADLEQTNMFMLRLDDRREWYRYHRLFAEFLRTETDTQELQSLHQKAGAWCETHGRGEEAVRHALAAQDVAGAVRLFRAEVEHMLCRGEILTLLAWLEALPDSTVAAHSDLAGYKAWLLYLNGHTAAAQVYSAMASVEKDTEVPRACRGMLFAVQAYLALNWGEPKETVPLTQQALDYLGDSPSFFRAYALSFLGQAQDLTGHRKAGVETLRQAVELGRKLGNHLVSLDTLTHLVPLMSTQGQLREAILACRNAADRYVDARGRPLPVAGTMYASLGFLYFETDELELARDCLTKALPLCHELGMVYFTLIAELALAKLQHTCGEREDAWTTLATAREIVERSKSPRRRRLFVAAVADLELREGNIAAAVRTLDDGFGTASLVSDDERLLQVRLLIAQHKLQVAEDMLSSIEESAAADGSIGTLAACHVQRTLCKLALGDRAAALKALENAVSLAASTGHRRMFLDEGPKIGALLVMVRHVAPVFVNSLLARINYDKDAVPGVQALPEPLSKTELNVLKLLNRGLSNKQIADELDITVGTTRWHLNHIFGKLRVSNRTAAIVRARQLNLV